LYMDWLLHHLEQRAFANVTRVFALV